MENGFWCGYEKDNVHSKDGKVEDGKSVHNMYFMVKNLKAITGVYVKIDII